MFKNLLVYRAKGFNDRAAVISGLSQNQFTPCCATDKSRMGWVAPNGGELTHHHEGNILVSLCTETKVLPSSAIKLRVAEVAAEIETAQGFKPGRKHLKEIKERVQEELAGRALARRSYTRAWIDTNKGTLVIDASSVSKADDLLGMLHKSVPGIEVSPLKTTLSATTAMTNWLSACEAPEGFSIDRECELVDPAGDQPTVKYARANLEQEKVAEQIAMGKKVTRLAMTWNDSVSFVLHDNAQIKKVSYTDMLTEKRNVNAESADEQFNADFCLMTGDLGKFLADIVDALGGEHQPT
jgi:recombination associated protein RdgC